MTADRWPTSWNQMQQLSPDEFEHFVADIYSEQGYDTKKLQLSHDRSRDVVADKDGQRTVIQAKRNAKSNRLGPGEVQKYSSVLHEGDVDKVAIVTTSTLTGGGWETANRISDLEIVTGDRLEDWATKYHPKSASQISSNQQATGSGYSSAQNVGTAAGALYRGYVKLPFKIMKVLFGFVWWWFALWWGFIKALFGFDQTEDGE